MTSQELLEALYKQQTEILTLLKAKFTPKQRLKANSRGIIPLHEQIKPFESKLPPSEVFKFINYWTEENLVGTERWQKEKTWNIEKRLARWMMNVREREYKDSQRTVRVNEMPKQDRSDRVDGGFSKLI